MLYAFLEVTHKEQESSQIISQLAQRCKSSSRQQRSSIIRKGVHDSHTFHANLEGFQNLAIARIHSLNIEQIVLKKLRKERTTKKMIPRIPHEQPRWRVGCPRATSSSHEDNRMTVCYEAVIVTNVCCSRDYVLSLRLCDVVVIPFCAVAKLGQTR